MPPFNTESLLARLAESRAAVEAFGAAQRAQSRDAVAKARLVAEEKAQAVVALRDQGEAISGEIDVRLAEGAAYADALEAAREHLADVRARLERLPEQREQALEAQRAAQEAAGDAAHAARAKAAASEAHLGGVAAAVAEYGKWLGLHLSKDARGLRVSFTAIDGDDETRRCEAVVAARAENGSEVFDVVAGSCEPELPAEEVVALSGARDLRPILVGLRGLFRAKYR